jgi:hypothetical protein
LNKKNQIQHILSEIENSPVECDGFARLASYLLTTHNISHQIYMGSLTTNTGQIPMHFWLKCGDFIIDYRAKMWLGNTAPHGVFDNTLPDTQYQGELVFLKLISKELFQIMSAPFPIELLDNI